MNLPIHAMHAPATREAIAAELAALVARFSLIDGEHQTAVPLLIFYRYSAPSRQEYAFSKVSLILLPREPRTSSRARRPTTTTPSTVWPRRSTCRSSGG